MPQVLFIGFSLLFCALTAFFPLTSYGLHIVIDPGHGGSDRGATRGPIQESVIALDVAKILAQRLNRVSGLRASLTRHSDTHLSLRARTEIVHRIKGDLLISIHANASEDEKAQGVEFYFQNQLPPDEESQFLASRENEERDQFDAASEKKGDWPIRQFPAELNLSGDVRLILEDLDRNHRTSQSSVLVTSLLGAWRIRGPHRSLPIRQAPFYVVTKTQVPSALIELGYVTHPEEGPRLAKKDHQISMAEQLFQGLLNYKEKVDKTWSQSLDSGYAK